MKIVSYIGIIVLGSLLSCFDAAGQNCNKFHLYGSCMQYAGPGFKMDGQSRSNTIGVGDKLVYNAVFYGDRDYKLYFCTSDLFKPVHFILLDGFTRELIYDNKSDDYSDFIELSVDNTRRIMIEVSVLATGTEPQFTENYFGCVGFLMNYKTKKK